MKTTFSLTRVFVCFLTFPVATALYAGTITRDQAIAFVQNTWGFYDLSSDVVSETLDTSWSGVPYEQLVDFLVKAPDFLRPLARNDYSTAAQAAYQYALGAASAKLISEVGLTGVAAPAQLALWPIENELNAFNQAINDAAFKDQCSLYFLARNPPDSYSNQQLVLKSAPNILFTDDGWLYIVDSTEERAGFPRGYFASAEQFYSYADTLYQAQQAALNFDSTSRLLARSFHDAATAGPFTPTPPTIVSQPESVTVALGDYPGFTVVANGTGPLRYQWQRNGVDIPGASGFVYSMGPVQAANSGDEFTVRVSNAQGTKTSSAATLTVSGASSSSLSISYVSPTQLQASQTLHIYGSGFTSTSALIFIHAGSGLNSQPALLHFKSANQIDYDLPADAGLGTWQVAVVDANRESPNLGAFTVVAPPTQSSGALTVTLLPPEALGAQWSLDGGTYRSSGDTISGLSPGAHVISCKPVSGYVPPAAFTVIIAANQQTTTNATYTAIAASTYTLTLNPGGGLGSISPSPVGTRNVGAYVYPSGATVQLLATANPGYHFVGWSGNLSGSANPASITMDGNKGVTASFDKGDNNLGTVIVTIHPSDAVLAGAQWKLNGTGWMKSGDSYETPLVDVGMNYLQFKDVPGWVTPKPFFVSVGGGQTTNVPVVYQLDMTPGLVTVTLSPQAAVMAGAKWHVNGSAYGNGAAVSLPPGNYTISFDNLPGWTPPASQVLSLQPAQSELIPVKYTPSAGQPVITGIMPSIGPLSGGTALTIEGFNFAPGTTVSIGGQVALNINILDGTRLTCVTPLSAVYGTASVVVQTSGGSSTSANGFAYGNLRGNGIELVGSIGGWVNAVAVQGTYCYYGEGGTFVVLDVSSPGAPTPIGRLAMPGLVQDIALFSASTRQYAAVADYDAGLQIVDITNPTAPVLRGYYDTGDTALGIFVLGANAYVANGKSGLWIFDVSDPLRVQRLGSVDTAGNASRALVQASASGVLAYVISSGALLVVDASDPHTPRVRGRTGQLLTLGDSPSSLAVSGTQAYLADGFTYLQGVDISNPDSPQPLGSVPPSADAVAVSGGYVFTFGVLGLTIYDPVTGKLRQVGNLHISGDTSFGDTMVIQGSYAYCAGGRSGLYIYSVSTPSSPTVAGGVAPTSGEYNAVAINGNYAYVPTQGSGLKTFDLREPTSPVLLNQFSSGSGDKILIDGTRAFLLASGGEIKILDISNPNQPPVLLGGSSQSKFFVFDFYLIGNSLVAAGNDTTLIPQKPAVAVFDVSNPAAIQIRSPIYFTTQDGVAVVSITGNANIACAVVGDWLAVIDLTNSSNLRQIGQLSNIGDVPVRAARLAADNRYLYLGGQSDLSWKIVDLADTAAPILVSSNDAGVPVAGFDVSGKIAYVTTWKDILVYDVSNAAQPQLLRSYKAPEAYTENSLAVAGSKLYVANGRAGLISLQLSDIDAPQVFITTPPPSPVLTTQNSSLTLGGSANDNQGLAQGTVTRVTWSNSRGGGGDASGTQSWLINGATLQPGTNVLTVMASDEAGNTGSASLTVVYQPPTQSQIVTFLPIGDRTFGDAPFPLQAAASSGLPVKFTVVSGPASIANNNVLTVTGAGAVTVQADQSGDDLFNPAAPQDVSFNVARADQSIAFAPLADRPVTDGSFALSATASSGLPVFYTIVSGPAMLADNLVTLLGGGTVRIDAWQPGNTNYNAALTVQRSFEVLKTPQTITFGQLSAQRFGDAPFFLSATASSGLPVSFSLISGPATLSGNIVTLTGSGTVALTASQPGNDFFAPALDVTQSFFVSAPDITLTKAQRLPDGRFQVGVYGVVGNNYTLQVSSNLIDWVSLFAFTCTDSPTTINDTGAPVSSYLFYRVQAQ